MQNLVLKDDWKMEMDNVLDADGRIAWVTIMGVDIGKLIRMD